MRLLPGRVAFEGLNAEQQKAMQAEARIVWFRAAIIAFNIVAYYAFMDAAGTIPALAAMVSILAGGYAVYTTAFQPYLRFPILTTSAFTAATDSILITVWLAATGGPASPFFPLWMASLIALAFRYGPRITMIAAPVYAVADLGQAFVVGGPAGLAAMGPGLVVRPVYIAFVGGLGALLAKDSRDAFESRAQAQADLAEAHERERQRSREEERWRTLASASQEGLVIHKDGVILEANHELSRILGRSIEELRGMDIHKIVVADDHGVLDQRLATTPGMPYELRVRRGDGAIVDIETKAREMEYHGVPVRVASVRDLTEEKRAEAVRKQAEVQEAELDRLRAEDAFKSRFINSAAHELNTPITPLMIQLHLLRKASTGGAPGGDAQHAVDILERNLRRLSTLVTDMLDVARLQGGHMSLEPQRCDLTKIVQDEIETWAAQAAARDLRLVVHGADPVEVTVDPVRVTQVVSNLLSNAVKFTEGGGRIDVRVEPTADGGRITVQDTGLGLTADQKSRLFQPFSRVHADADVAGTGLGLYICQGIMTAMGGKIACQSPGPGKGSTFTADFAHLPPELLDVPYADVAQPAG